VAGNIATGNCTDGTATRLPAVLEAVREPAKQLIGIKPTTSAFRPESRASALME
jgi:hypothetical protein